MQSAEITKALLLAFKNAEPVDHELKNLPKLLVALSKISDLLDIQSDYNRSSISFSLAVLEENRSDQIIAVSTMNDLNSKTNTILLELFNALLDLITDHLKKTVVSGDGMEAGE